MSPAQSVFLAFVSLAMGASFVLWALLVRRRVHGEPILEERPLPRPTWYPEALIFIGALWLGLPVVLSRAGFLGDLGPGREPDPLQLVKLTCLVNGLLLVGIPGILAWIGEQRAEEFGMSLDDWPGDLRIGVLAFVAALVPVYLVLVISLPWRTEEDQHAFLRLLDDDPSLQTLAWVVVSAVVLAPLAEELLYRVVLQGWLESRMRPWLAIGLGAVLFAGAHGSADAWALLPLALILGYVYHRRRSYLAIAVAHAAFNAFNLAAKLVTGA